MTEPSAPAEKRTIVDLISIWVRRPVFWGALFLCWFGLLYYLSSGPVTVRPGFEIPHADKIAHFIYFAGGGTGLHLLLRFHPKTSGLAPWKRILIVTAIIALFGWFDEWHQSWIPERTGNDIWDWTADMLGGLLSIFIARPIGRFIERATANRPTLADSAP